MTKILLIALGGAAGSVLRYWVSLRAVSIIGWVFPYGTLAVNAFGGLLMGLCFVLIFDMFDHLKEHLQPLILVGFVGGFTTFSAFSLELLELVQRQEIMKAGLNVLLSVVICVTATWLGMALGGWMQKLLS